MMRMFDFGWVAWALLSLPVSATTSENYLDLDLQQQRYLGGVQHSTQLANYTLVSGELNLEDQPSWWRFKLNPVGQGAIGTAREFYFGVPEAYVQSSKLSRNISVTLGRQKRTWSRLDEYFNLGIWQPQLRWDYLAPRQQGLIGLFIDTKVNSSWSLSLLVSPLNIPDQGPQFQLRNGRFESENRWFVQPQSRFRLFQGTPGATEAPLNFALERPGLNDIVFNPTFAGSLQFTPSQSFWTQISYAYKPRNQIHLGIECTFCTKISSQGDDITAVVHARVVKHHVLTWEAGYERVDDRLWVSVTSDTPDSSGMPNNWEEAPLDPMLVAGIGYQQHMRTLFNRPTWLNYTYMKAFQSGQATRGSLLNDDQVSSSFERYPFRELAAFEAKLLVLSGAKRKIHLNNRYSYSIPEQGGWLSTSVEWLENGVSWSFGMDILGAQVNPTSANAGLFSRYRANDRFFAGVSYVF